MDGGNAEPELSVILCLWCVYVSVCEGMFTCVSERLRAQCVCVCVCVCFTRMHGEITFVVVFM